MLVLQSSRKWDFTANIPLQDFPVHLVATNSWSSKFKLHQIIFSLEKVKPYMQYANSLQYMLSSSTNLCKVIGSHKEVHNWIRFKREHTLQTMLSIESIQTLTSVGSIGVGRMPCSWCPLVGERELPNFAFVSCFGPAFGPARSMKQELPMTYRIIWINDLQMYLIFYPLLGSHHRPKVCNSQQELQLFLTEEDFLTFHGIIDLINLQTL